jgi:hypothetical protein
MKIKFDFNFLLLVFLSLLFITIQSCDPKDGCNDENNDSTNVVRKPNIYLYPENETDLNVFISFPLGGEIITSLPAYNDGWSVHVDTSGMINGEYDYLFYESIQPDIWQDNDGWIVEKKDLHNFFSANLSGYGFRGREIDDFMKYWIPRLNDHEYYLIYPQVQSIIDQVVMLNTSVRPDNVLRLFYVIKGTEVDNYNVTAPEINSSFKREGFFITEWGVILK